MSDDRLTTSDQHADDNYHEANHEGPIRTPKQLVIAVIFAFLVPISVIALLAAYVAADQKPAAGSDLLQPKPTAARIAPVGQVEVRAAADTSRLKSGADVYQAQCAACHTAGVAGAPKFGDQAAWAPRVQAGYETLLTSALKGKGAMGPQGGGDHSDLEIGRAVVHMANAAGAKFEEPKAAPAAAAPQAAAPTADAAQVAAAAEAVAAAKQGATGATPVAAGATAQAGAVPALYTQACQACHAAGVAGAPKLGDKAAWAPRLAQGIDGLTASVIKGKGAMPPKGGAAAASDADIQAAVSYMVASVQ